MDHIAIMKKSWKLLPKILSGDKTIESRWYMNKSAPWDKIKAGETVYFKDSGDPVTVKAQVSEVKQFDLRHTLLSKILEQYGSKSKICLSNPDPDSPYFKGKNYCILIFLKEVEPIKPFDINKKGFGISSAWLCVKDINTIKQ
ncbi:MAG: hypothetical protein AABX70_09245 [Nanoarchaeota archaeon]